MKIYLAGKIKRNCWRHDIVDGLAEALYDGCCDPHEEQSYTLHDWPVLENAIFLQHDYVGPFFAPGEVHRSHGDGTHGIQITSSEERRTTRDLCLSAIDEADLVFAWLDCKTAYGTLVELGYAKAQSKEIWISSPTPITDLWFAYGTADKYHTAGNASPADVLQRMLGIVNLTTMPYQDYLKTEHWQTIRKAELKNADYRCRLCYASVPLDVHHRTYERRGRELPNDVIALCRDCHAKFHNKPVAQLEYVR